MTETGWACHPDGMRSWTVQTPQGEITVCSRYVKFDGGSVIFYDEPRAWVESLVDSFGPGGWWRVTPVAG